MDGHECLIHLCSSAGKGTLISRVVCGTVQRVRAWLIKTNHLLSATAWPFPDRWHPSVLLRRPLGHLNGPVILDLTQAIAVTSRKLTLCDTSGALDPEIIFLANFTEALNVLGMVVTNDNVLESESI